MTMWLKVGVIYSGSLSFLDLALFSYYAFVFKGSALELGALSAAWSVVYIIANLSLGGLADRGSNKALAYLSLISTLLMAFFFALHSKVYVAIAYMFHALASTAAGLALSVSVLELLDSSSWGRANLAIRLGGYASRGILLILLSGTVEERGLTPYLYLAITLGAVLSLSVTPIGLPIERQLYRFAKIVDELVDRASSWSLYSGSINPSALYILNRSEREPRGFMSHARILIAMLLVVALGDYVFVAFTKMVAGKMAYSSYLHFMGAVALAICPVLYLLSRRSLDGKLYAASLTVLRGALFVIFLPRVNSPLDGALFMLASSALYASVEISLYSMYIQATEGYRTNLFFIAREAGSIVGSLAGGYLWVNAQSLYTPVAVAILALTLIQFLGKRRAYV